MGGSSLASDLVRDSKIETEWLDSCLRHVFYESGPSARLRRICREERWVRQKFVGRGAFGNVYLEQCEVGSSQKLRAVKEIKKSVIPGEELDYMRELEAVAKFSHQKYSHCFVQSHGWFELEDSIFITMEYLGYGDLQRYLQAPLSESEAKQITSQVLEGLSFMHDNDFVHRDLKPGNIMVVSKDPDWFVKITDFGVSKRRQQDVTTLHTMQRGTFGFVAPEVLELLPDKSYTFSVDMWSLGAVVYKILTNATAFQNFAELFKFANGMSTFPILELETVSTSKDAQDFILKLMMPNPKDRLSAASAIRHSWITTSTHSSSTNNMNQTHIETLDNTSPAGTDQIPDSMASKDWSTDSDDISTIRTNSSFEDVTVVASQLTELSVAADINDTASSDTARSIVPLPSGVSREVKYQKPSVDDYPEVTERYRKLPANSPFVLEPIESAELENHTAQTSPSTMLNTETSLQLEGKEPATILEDYVQRQEDRTDDCADESDGSITGSSDDNFSDWTDEDINESTADGVDVRGNGAVNIQTGSKAGENLDRNINILGPYRMSTYHCGGCNEFVMSGWRCNECLLEQFALSLVSPKYMPPETWRWYGFRRFAPKFILSSEVNRAWEILAGVQNQVQQGTWTCQRGHIPSEHSFQVTEEISPVWKDLVECSTCLADTSFPITVEQDQPTQRLTMKYCLYCSISEGICKCREWLHATVESFVEALRRNGLLTKRTSMMILLALSQKRCTLDSNDVSFVSFNQIQEPTKSANTIQSADGRMTAPPMGDTQRHDASHREKRGYPVRFSSTSDGSNDTKSHSSTDEASPSANAADFGTHPRDTYSHTEDRHELVTDNRGPHRQRRPIRVSSLVPGLNESGCLDCEQEPCICVSDEASAFKPAPPRLVRPPVVRIRQSNRDAEIRRGRAGAHWYFGEISPHDLPYVNYDTCTQSLDNNFEGHILPHGGLSEMDSNIIHHWRLIVAERALMEQASIV